MTIFFTLLLVATASAQQCELCPPNTFCFNETLRNCTLFSTSPSGSVNITDCHCQPGYYNPTLFSCDPCGPRHFCPGGPDRFECPPHSKGTFATSVSECECLPGFKRGIDTCIPCPRGFFEEGDSCTQCHQTTYNPFLNATSCLSCHNATSLHGSTSEKDCLCNAGYSGENNKCTPCERGKFSDGINATLCSLCPRGTYSFQTGATQCQPCPAHATTLSEGSFVLSDCKCNTGFEGTASSGCSVCPNGQFEKNSVCVNCPKGKYQDGTGKSNCKLCPDNSITLSTQSDHLDDCLCSAGRTQKSGRCRPCSTGYFKSTTSNDDCLPCEPGNFSALNGSAYCVPCPQQTFQHLGGQSFCFDCRANSTSVAIGNLNYLDCKCNPGFEINNCTNECTDYEACTMCKRGFFKTGYENVACQQCPFGKTTSKRGADQDVCFPCSNNRYLATIDGEAICLSCPVNTISESGSTDISQCKCGFGHGLYDGACSRCPFGTYSGYPSNTACTPCNAGFEGLNISTTMLRIWHRDACQPCKVNFFEVNDVCRPCPPNSVSTQQSTSCICNAGYAGSHASCAACEPGKFEMNDVCVSCEAGKYNDKSAQTHCSNCPPNSTSAAESLGIAECICEAGFIKNRLLCEACNAGTYASDGTCHECPANSYYPTRPPPYFLNLCEICPGNSTSEAGSYTVSQCICKPGFIRFDDKCQPCSAGSYCPDEVTQIPCPYFSSSYSMASTVEQCICNPGYFSTAPNCIECPPNTFCVGNGLITPCRSNSSTLTLSGQNSSDACMCDHGFYLADNVCEYCPRGSFCFRNEIRACPQNSTSLRGKYLELECICNAGSRYEDGVCVGCSKTEQNFLCPGSKFFDVQTVHLTTLINQPLSYMNQRKSLYNIAVAKETGIDINQITTTFTASTSAFAAFRRLLQTESTIGESEILNAYEVPTQQSLQQKITDVLDDVTIQISAVETSDATKVNAEIEECASHATADLVSHRCLCPPGHRCGNSVYSASCLSPSECIICNGTYCNDNTEYTCFQSAVASVGSSSINDCICLDGYYKQNQQCFLCPQNHYCTNNRKFACTDYDSLLWLPREGAGSRDQCMCQTGLFRRSRTDTCKQCPKNFWCPLEIEMLFPPVVACRENEYTLSVGSSGRAFCLCDAGHKLSSDGDTMKCLPCEEGERCQFGSVQESSCHIQDRIPNLEHTECVCMRGFYEKDTLCYACPSGTIKLNSGNQECTPCPQDTYAANSTLCIACNPPSISPPGSTECICVEPYDESCALCEAGKYLLNGNCESCPQNSTSPHGSTNIASCVCDAGFYRENNMCYLCPNNHFGVNEQCSACPAFSRSENGSTGIDACVCNPCFKKILQLPSCFGVCPQNSSCSACDPGHFQALQADTSCLPCARGFFQTQSEKSSCFSCPVTRNTYAAGSETAEACKCRPGFEPQNLTDDHEHNCTACHLGFIKPELADTDCHACPPNEFADASQMTVCKRCSDHSAIINGHFTVSHASTNVSDCTCNRGLFLNDNECTLCAAGSFKSVIGPDACIFCGTEGLYLNYYGDDVQGADTSGHCQPCPHNSGQDPDTIGADLNQMVTLDSCQCFPGFDSFSLHGCEECDEHKHRASYGREACQFCAENFYFEDKNLDCSPCSLSGTDGTSDHSLAYNVLYNNYSWATSQNDCVCNPGYERDGPVCEQCLEGKFRSLDLTVSHSHLCTDCPLSTFADSVGTVQCTHCPPHSFTIGHGNVALEACLCEAGFEWNTTHCVACTPGFFKEQADSSYLTDSGLVITRYTCQECASGTYENRSASSQCQNCLPNMHSHLPRSDVSHCECDPGFGGNPCASCEIGSFSGGGTSEDQHKLCTDCPEGKTTLNTTSVYITECLCKPGFGTEQLVTDPTDECFACQDGSYAEGNQNIPCISCGFGTVSEPSLSATSFDNCLCNAEIGLFVVFIDNNVARDSNNVETASVSVANADSDLIDLTDAPYTFFSACQNKNVNYEHCKVYGTRPHNGQWKVHFTVRRPSFGYNGYQMYQVLRAGWTEEWNPEESQANSEDDHHWVRLDFGKLVRMSAASIGFIGDTLWPESSYAVYQASLKKYQVVRLRVGDDENFFSSNNQDVGVWPSLQYEPNANSKNTPIPKNKVNTIYFDDTTAQYAFFYVRLTINEPLCTQTDNGVTKNMCDISWISMMGLHIYQQDLGEGNNEPVSVSS